MKKLIQENKEYTAAVEKLLAAFGNTPSGQSVPWPAWDAVSPYQHKTSAGRVVLTRFRNRIWERRKIRILIKGGLVFRTRGDMVTEYATWRAKRSRRQALRGKRDVEAQPVNELNFHEKRVRLAGVASLTLASRAAFRASHEVTIAATPTKTIPRRPEK